MEEGPDLGRGEARIVTHFLLALVELDGERPRNGGHGIPASTKPQLSRVQ